MNLPTHLPRTARALALSAPLDAHAEPDGPASRSARRDSAVGVAFMLLFSLTVIIVHLVPPGSRAGMLWGADLWAFLPPWACEASVALVALAAAPLMGWFVSTLRDLARAGTVSAPGEAGSARGGATARERRLIL